MPRDFRTAPEAEQTNNLNNILNDFKQGKARIYRGLPALRVYVEKDAGPRHIPTRDFAWYEHPDYGDDVYSIITNVHIEHFFKINFNTKAWEPPKKKGEKEGEFVRNYKYERVFIDVFLTPTEKAAFDVNDFTNPNNVLKMLKMPIIQKDESSGQQTVYRSGIREAILGYKYEPETVEMGVTQTDVWPSGPYRGQYLANLDKEFLDKTIREGSDVNATGEFRRLAEIAQNELDRRKKQADESLDPADKIEKELVTGRRRGRSNG
jgi:hypothetical protein